MSQNPPIGVTIYYQPDYNLSFEDGYKKLKAKLNADQLMGLAAAVMALFETMSFRELMGIVEIPYEEQEKEGEEFEEHIMLIFDETYNYVDPESMSRFDKGVEAGGNVAELAFKNLGEFMWTPDSTPVTIENIPGQSLPEKNYTITTLTEKGTEYVAYCGNAKDFVTVFRDVFGWFRQPDYQKSILSIEDRNGKQYKVKAI